VKTGRPSKLKAAALKSQSHSRKQKVNIALPPLHPGQIEVRDHPARFKVLAAGRRWRKTSFFVTLGIALAISGQTGWMVGPDFPMISVAWRMAHNLVDQIAAQAPKGFVKIIEKEKIILFPTTGGFFQFKSAENPDTLRGIGLDFLFMDECPFIRERAWNEILRPALSDRKGRAFFGGTPQGMDWFYRLFRKGDPQDSEYDHDWKSWRFASVTNPFMDPAEIESAKRDMPALLFAQEYLVEFLNDLNSPFRRIDEVFTAPEQLRARPGHVYGCAADWAKINDFTVYTVCDICCRQFCYIDRFNEIDFHVQLNRLTALSQRFGNFQWIMAEENNMGAALIEQLQRAGLPVQAMRASPQTKNVWIEALMNAFERVDIKYVDHPQAKSEFRAFGFRRLPSGIIQYCAPEGMKDDCVMSGAMCYQGLGTSYSLDEFHTEPIDQETVDISWGDEEIPDAIDIGGAI
jgi:hypothetical protein